MSVLDDLIKIKTSKQEDDVLKMMDEIPVYEKLSVDEKLKDLKTSAVTRAKCPMLARFADGGMYETVLAELVQNIYMQVEGRIPEVLDNIMFSERNAKQTKQMDILQKGIARIEYRDIMEYDHETMQNVLTAVFINKAQNIVTAALIVKDANSYIMYHGSYVSEDIEHMASNSCQKIVIKGKHGAFTMESYSVLGNNGYKFGVYQNSHVSYSVMIGPDDTLYLINNTFETVAHKISHEEKNRMNFIKNDPHAFAEQITTIIESVV